MKLLVLLAVKFALRVRETSLSFWRTSLIYKFHLPDRANFVLSYHIFKFVQGGIAADVIAGDFGSVSAGFVPQTAGEQAELILLFGDLQGVLVPFAGGIGDDKHFLAQKPR